MRRALVHRALVVAVARVAATETTRAAAAPEPPRHPAATEPPPRRPTLAFVLTPGRAGTTSLASWLGDLPGVRAHHGPQDPPRDDFIAFLGGNASASNWFATLPREGSGKSYGAPAAAADVYAYLDVPWFAEGMACALAER